MMVEVIQTRRCQPVLSREKKTPDQIAQSRRQQPDTPVDIECHNFHDESIINHRHC